MNNTIEVKPIQTKEAQDAAIVASSALKQAKAVVIKDQASYNQAAEIGKSARASIKTLETKRKEITIPLDETKKKVMDLFKAPIAFYTRVKEVINQNMIEYTDAQEKLRLEQEEKLKAQAEAEELKKKKALEKKAEKAEEQGNTKKAEELREQKEQVFVQAPVLAKTPPAPKGVSYRTQWSAEITDFTVLPDKYKLPNYSMLNEAAEVKKGKSDIPGALFKSKKLVVSRAK